MNAPALLEAWHFIRAFSSSQNASKLIYKASQLHSLQTGARHRRRWWQDRAGRVDALHSTVLVAGVCSGLLLDYMDPLVRPLCHILETSYYLLGWRLRPASHILRPVQPTLTSCAGQKRS